MPLDIAGPAELLGLLYLAIRSDLAGNPTCRTPPGCLPSVPTSGCGKRCPSAFLSGCSQLIRKMLGVSLGSPGSGGDASEPLHRTQALGSARPVSVERLGTCCTCHRSQYQGNDDRVICVADDRDEVRHQVDGEDQVDQQECQPDPHPTGKRGVGG